METIGKVLSITLLTIFGSAAATVYLVDSDIMPSFFGKSVPVYTSDRAEKPAENADIYEVPARKERERESFKYNVVEERAGDVENYNNIKPVWGQSYDTNPVSARRSAERAREIAGINSLDSILQNINYWNDRYSTAQREGRQAAAQNALRNYTEYTEALEIKQSADR